MNKIMHHGTVDNTAPDTPRAYVKPTIEVYKVKMGTIMQSSIVQSNDSGSDGGYFGRDNSLGTEFVWEGEQ